MFQVPVLVPCAERPLPSGRPGRKSSFVFEEDIQHLSCFGQLSKHLFGAASTSRAYQLVLLVLLHMVHTYGYPSSTTCCTFPSILYWRRGVFGVDLLHTTNGKYERIRKADSFHSRFFHTHYGINFYFWEYLQSNLKICKIENGEQP